ncbi:MAG: RNA polymerase sigma factor [Lentimicrobiaceae bacterium]|mgnify:CR=1 FL=1|nr:RNA polymerase sigma factor [Lentimicrobiaceae bacterium]MCO5265068.1 RNA polymerase sigma factor [Lentimicrobium sp.]
MNQPDDNHLIQQVLDGNTGAYSLIVDRYKDLVYTVVIKIIRNREEAEEAAQDTFLKAFHALPSFKREAKFTTWLFRIAYNTAISRTRKKQLTTTAIDDKMIENYSTDEIKENIGQLNEEEQSRMLQIAIKTLASDEQLLINLFYHNHQSIEEIASITGLSDTNVKVKLHRIRKKLYMQMQSNMQPMLS